MNRMFYRKLSPDIPATLGNMARVKFVTLDNLVGYFSTDNQYIQEQFALMQRENRGGIFTIDSGEYDRDYTQKKMLNPNPPGPLMREELGRGLRLTPSPLDVLGAARVQEVVGGAGVVVSPPATINDPPKGAAAAKLPDMPTVKQEFKPPTGKRVPKKGKE